MSFFQNNPKAEVQRSYVHAALNVKREHSRNFCGFLPPGYCERKPRNLEKTTSNL